MLTTIVAPLLPDRFDELVEQQVGKNYATFFHARNGLYHVLKYLNARFKCNVVYLPEGICGVVPLICTAAEYQIKWYRDGSEPTYPANTVLLRTDSRYTPYKNVFQIQDSAKTSVMPVKGFDFTMFSLNQDKPISAGYGGMIVVNNPDFLDFLNIRSSIKKPGLKEELRSYYVSIEWKVRSYGPVRAVLRKALQTAVGTEKAKGQFNPNGKVENLNMGITNISRRLASTHLTLNKN